MTKTFLTYRIHDLSNMKEENMLEAHDSEVLCLEYTEPQTGEWVNFIRAERIGSNSYLFAGMVGADALV